MHHAILINLICVPYVLYFIYDEGAYFISCGWYRFSMYRFRKICESHVPFELLCIQVLEVG